MRIKFSALLFFITILFYEPCRAQDVITKIADSCCVLLRTMDTTQGPDVMNEQLNDHLMKYATPFKEELKSRFNIDLEDKSGKQWETLGQLIGGKMAVDCPDMLMVLARAEERADQNEMSPQFYEGTVTEIRKDMFCYSGY